jgi:hypothetical protein
MSVMAEISSEQWHSAANLGRLTMMISQRSNGIIPFDPARKAV